MKDLVEKTLSQVGSSQPKLSEQQAKDSAQVIDKVFNGLKRIFPAYHVTMKESGDEDGIKKEWARALSQHGITTQEQIAKGFKYARLHDSPYFPSVGMFIKWCSTNEGPADPSHVAFLPEPEFTEEDQKRGQEWLKKIKGDL